MILSSILGLVLAVGSTTGQLPAAEQQMSSSQQPPRSLVPEQTQPSLETPPIEPLTKGPFKGLFQTQPPLRPAPSVAAGLFTQLAANKKVVCGLAMWPVDPNTDPKIHLSSPSPEKSAQKPMLERQHDFKVRRITPTMCHE